MRDDDNQPKSTFDRLQKEDYVPEQELMIRPMISVKEKGVRYQLKTTDGVSSAVFAVDNNIITQGDRCDKLILVNPINHERMGWMETFVELKGSDIKHAISQIRNTLTNPLFIHPSNKVIRARIVGHSFPSNKADSVMERARQEFSKRYHCDLRGTKNGQIDSM